jgi:hypothetical protein
VWQVRNPVTNKSRVGTPVWQVRNPVTNKSRIGTPVWQVRNPSNNQSWVTIPVWQVRNPHINQIWLGTLVWQVRNRQFLLVKTKPKGGLIFGIGFGTGIRIQNFLRNGPGINWVPPSIYVWNQILWSRTLHGLKRGVPNF